MFYDIKTVGAINQSWRLFVHRCKIFCFHVKRKPKKKKRKNSKIPYRLLTIDSL